MLRPIPLYPVAMTAVVGVAVLSLGACSENDRDVRRQGGTAAASRAEGDAGTGGSAGAATQPATFTGTLRGSAVAIGGETTGWRLEGDNETGGIDVDVSRVTDRAKALDGKRVSVSGKMATRSWAERGETQVLVVDRIEEVPSPAPGAGRTPAAR